jgi:phosphoribosylaminoimidazole-succinocarboxamide synthase
MIESRHQKYLVPGIDQKKVKNYPKIRRSTMNTVIRETNLEGLDLWRRGKVRDVYDLGDSLLIVATDRISAFDVVMDDPIPGKGQMLTQISKYWFEVMSDIIPNHVISFDIKDFPDRLKPFATQIEGRSMWVKKAEPLAVECIVRGYISGSGWKDYVKTGKICGYTLPEGMVESQRLGEAIFTPSTKAEKGLHDENISVAEAGKIVGRELMDRVQKISLDIYTKAADIARAKGVIIADTKFEFGLYQGKLILIDELLTPDSSRFWPKDQYRPGGPQPSFDKQFLRDYLESLDWDKKPPAPRLPKEIIQKTKEKYEEARRILTSKK